MKLWISKCLLALAVLQGIIPAGQCVLKLAGLCNCGTGVALVEPCSSCCDQSPQKRCNHNAPDDQKNPCCAYTPAHGLTAEAPAAPNIDTHYDCIAYATMSPLDFLRACTTFSAAVPASASPQSPDTPLFLRVHTFLI